MNCNQSTNKSEGTKERKMSSLSRDYYCGQFSFYPLWSRFTHTRRVHLLFFPCLLVVGLAEVTFGLLALCPHYTRLSAFVFSKENKATQRNETCRWQQAHHNRTEQSKYDDSLFVCTSRNRSRIRLGSERIERIRDSHFLSSLYACTISFPTFSFFFFFFYYLLSQLA